jgi:hypothetical protein
MAIGQIHMGRNMGLYLRFHRLCQQLASSGSQNIGQRIIGKLSWLLQRNNCIVSHGVSLFFGKWRLHQRQDTPPSFFITKIQL